MRKIDKGELIGFIVVMLFALLTGFMFVWG